MSRSLTELNIPDIHGRIETVPTEAGRHESLLAGAMRANQCHSLPNVEAHVSKASSEDGDWRGLTREQAIGILVFRRWPSDVRLDDRTTWTCNLKKRIQLDPTRFIKMGIQRREFLQAVELSG